MLGGREVLPLLEVRHAGWGPAADTDIDATPEVEEEHGPAVLLVSWGATSAGGRTSVDVGSHATPIRIRRDSASSLPIKTALYPTSSTSWMFVGMSR